MRLSDDHTPPAAGTARQRKGFPAMGKRTPHWIARVPLAIVVSWWRRKTANDLYGRRLPLRRHSRRAGDAGDRWDARGVWDPESGFSGERQDSARGVRRVAPE